MLKLQLRHEVNGRQLQLDIDTAQPAIYALRGPSGVGKTTLLNGIAGLIDVDDAYIAIHGRVLTDTAKGQKVKIQQRNIGYLFQDFQLFPTMTVAQNITFMAAPSAHITSLLTELKIAHLETHYPSQLSGGEAQRVALARALSTKPDLLLLDEPFSSLDDDTKEEGIRVIRTLFKTWGIPIIFVTHSEYEAAQLAHHVIHL